MFNDRSVTIYDSIIIMICGMIYVIVIGPFPRTFTEEWRAAKV